MAEKKTATKKVATEKAAPAKKATKATTAKAAAVKAEKVEAPKAVKAAKAPAKKACATKATKAALYINAESVGFRAGDVYQTLAAAGKNLTVAEIAKAANLSTEEVLLGLGWLFKEGKVVGENVADLRLA